MNSYSSRLLWLKNFSPGCFVNLLLLTFLLGLAGLSWIINGLLMILGIIIITPVIAFLIFKWWLKNNLVYGHCPVCNSELTSFRNTESYCLNCGEALQIKNGEFHCITSVDTVDVEIVDSYDNQIESSS